MTLFSDRRGSNRIYLLLISLTITAIVLVMTFNVAIKHSRGKSYQLNFYAQDISLLLESVQAVPGDITLSYHLQEGFVVLLREEELEVVYKPSGLSKTKHYHVLPGMRVQPQTVEEFLTITKRDDQLGITTEPPSARQGCPPLIGLDPSTLDITVTTEPPSATSPIGTDQLARIKEGFEFLVASEQGTATPQNAVSLAITITARPSTDGLNSLFVERPEARGDMENNYQHFFCAFLEHLDDADITVRESLVLSPTDDYEFKLIFAVTPDNAVLANRHTYADAFINALTEEVSP
ncbi:hypothetical protein GF367_02945 [Candidatus Woesearchaeota archaeon]|nr:hypothetical protein [Candidatus Woesearchaeota archaeon]